MTNTIATDGENGLSNSASKRTGEQFTSQAFGLMMSGAGVAVGAQLMPERLNLK